MAADGPVLAGPGARAEGAAVTRGGFFSVDSLRGVHVLVVDDEPDGRDLLTAILQYGGALVIAVGSAGEALDHMRLVKPDVLVADIAMPEHDGYWLIGAVRSLKPEDGGVVPAIAVSGRVRPANADAARTAGFDAFLTKPLDPWELCRVIAQLTEGR
jgi:CheY-like chemotaxis protein